MTPKHSNHDRKRIAQLEAEQVELASEIVKFFVTRVGEVKLRNKAEAIIDAAGVKNETGVAVAAEDDKR
jgi:hypothetical protein